MVKSSVAPKLQLVNDYKYPFFRFVVSLGVISDIVYNEKKKAYQKLSKENNPKNCIQTDWSNGLNILSFLRMSVGMDDI